MKISFWALGWRSLWRDMRAGDLRLLIVAVTLAVAALTAVGFFADRLKVDCNAMHDNCSVGMPSLPVMRPHPPSSSAKRKV